MSSRHWAGSSLRSPAYAPGASRNGGKTIGAGGIEPLEGMPLDGFTGQLHARGSEKLGPDTLEMYGRD